MKPKDINQIIKLLHLMENLKIELRHSWSSIGRQESIAEHSWRVAFMIILLAPHLKEEINVEKALKMAIIHDCAEAKTGDTHLFETLNNPDKMRKKFEKEKKVMSEIRAFLSDETGNEIYDLWFEFECNESYEAKFVLAVDKMEALLQHNEADIETWTSDEIRSIFNDYLDEFCSFDSSIKEFKKAIINESLIVIKSSRKIKSIEKEYSLQ